MEIKFPESQFTKTTIEQLLQYKAQKENLRLEIFPGAVLEVWLSGDVGPKPCIIIEEDLSGPSGDWRILTGEIVTVLGEDRIFQPGKATPPPTNSFAMPIVRRVFPTLSVNQLVSIQPMTAPAASCFYYDYKYDEKTVQYSPGKGKTIRNDIQTSIKARTRRQSSSVISCRNMVWPSVSKKKRRSHVRRTHVRS